MTESNDSLEKALEAIEGFRKEAQQKLGWNNPLSPEKVWIPKYLLKGKTEDEIELILKEVFALTETEHLIVEFI